MHNETLMCVYLKFTTKAMHACKGYHKMLNSSVKVLYDCHKYNLFVKAKLPGNYTMKT